MLVSRNGQFWVCGAIAFLFNLAGCGAMLPLSDNWCSPTYQCPGAGALIEHTMCTYGPKPPADRCHGLRDVQTDEKRTLIVDSLNAARLQLSRGKLSNWPEAADMREISYDYDLEKIALRWAAQCVKGSDKCRRTRDWPHVGQIVSETASDEPIDTDAYWPRDEIRQWLMEAELADPAAIDAYVPNERSARFTQLIWAETYKVGCADVIYETKDQAGRYRRKVVCNFGPGGNVPGAKIYSTGPICSECPAGVKCICGGHIPVHQDAAAPPADGAAPPADGAAPPADGAAPPADGAAPPADGAAPPADGAAPPAAGAAPPAAGAAPAGGVAPPAGGMAPAQGFMFQTEDPNSGLDLEGGLNEDLQPAKGFAFERDDAMPMPSSTTPKKADGAAASEGPTTKMTTTAAAGGNDTHGSGDMESSTKKGGDAAAIKPMMAFVGTIVPMLYLINKLQC